MNMAITTTTSLPAPIQASFNKKLLAVPVPNFIFAIPAMKMQMSRNGGTTERWRRYQPLQPALVPLGNSGIDIVVPGKFSLIDLEAQA